MYPANTHFNVLFLHFQGQERIDEYLVVL